MNVMVPQVTDNPIVYCAENTKTHSTGNLGVESTDNQWIPFS